MSELKRYGYEMFKLLIFSILISFIIPSVTGAFLDNQYMHFNLTISAQDNLNNQNFTNCAGVPTYSSTGALFKSSESDCIYAKGIKEILIKNSKSFSYCTQYKFTTLSGTMVLYDEHQDASSSGHILRVGDSGAGVYKFNIWANSNSAYVGNALSINTDYDICFTFNETSNVNKLYVNSNSSVTHSADVTDGAGTLDVYMSRYTHSATNYYDGNILGFCGWRDLTNGRVLNKEEVTEFMNYGCSGKPSFDTQTPTPNFYVNRTGYYNLTLNSLNTCHENCLLFNGSLINILNFSAFPYTINDLINNTLYNFTIKIYNSSYDLKLSNFSNTIINRTKQTIQVNPPIISNFTLLLEYVNITNENLIEINEAISMLWIIILYLGLMYFGMMLIQSGSFLTGISLLSLSLGLDFMIVPKLLNNYFIPYFSNSWDGNMYIIGSFIIGLWIFIKIGVLLFSKFTLKKMLNQ